MTQAAIELVFKSIPWTTGTAAQRATALDHKVTNHPVKVESIVEVFVCKIDEACHGDGRLLWKESEIDGALACFNSRSDIQSNFPD